MKLSLIVDLGKGWQKIDGTPVKIEGFSAAYGASESAGMSGVVGDSKFSPERFRLKIEDHFCKKCQRGDGFNGLVIGDVFDRVRSYNFVKFTEE